MYSAMGYFAMFALSSRLWLLCTVTDTSALMNAVWSAHGIIACINMHTYVCCYTCASTAQLRCCMAKITCMFDSHTDSIARRNFWAAQHVVSSTSISHSRLACELDHAQWVHQCNTQFACLPQLASHIGTDNSFYKLSGSISCINTSPARFCLCTATTQLLDVMQMWGGLLKSACLHFFDCLKITSMTVRFKPMSYLWCKDTCWQWRCNATSVNILYNVLAIDFSPISRALSTFNYNQRNNTKTYSWVPITGRR